MKRMRFYTKNAIGKNIYRRNSIIAACLDVANLMERGGTGFQTMIESYRECADHLHDLSNVRKVLELLRTEGPKLVKELQVVTDYKSRSQFLIEVINPLIDEEIIYRDGNVKSPKSLIKLKHN